MRQVAILGTGQTKIDEHWDKSLKELAGEAAFAALADAGLKHADALFVGNMLSPLISGQNRSVRSFQIGSGCGARRR